MLWTENIWGGRCFQSKVTQRSLCLLKKKGFPHWIVCLIICLAGAEDSPHGWVQTVHRLCTHSRPRNPEKTSGLFVLPQPGDHSKRPVNSVHRTISRTHKCRSVLFTTSFLITAQEEDLQEMKQSAEGIDECYGHWVDYVLVKEDPASAFAELQLVLERLHVEPQWVPVSWVRQSGWAQLQVLEWNPADRSNCWKPSSRVEAIPSSLPH